MSRMGLLLLSALGLALPSCTRDDTQVAEKLDQLIKMQQEQGDLIKQIASAPRGAAPAARGAAGAQQAPRKRPEPGAVYAVPSDGAYLGVKDAKVTIVDAFEFA